VRPYPAVPIRGRAASGAPHGRVRDRSGQVRERVASHLLLRALASAPFAKGPEQFFSVHLAATAHVEQVTASSGSEYVVHFPISPNKAVVFGPYGVGGSCPFARASTPGPKYWPRSG
jgi:hypothetical protein